MAVGAEMKFGAERKIIFRECESKYQIDEIIVAAKMLRLSASIATSTFSVPI